MKRALVERHMPLARKLARRAAWLYHQDFDDMYSDALFGLVIAEAHCQNSATFTQYAQKCIRGSILRGIRDRSGIRSYYERGETPPVIVPLKAIPFYRSDPGQELERAELWSCVDDIGPVESLVTKLYYKWELSQSEIAELFGFNQMRVSRILAKVRCALAEYYDVVLVVPEEEADEIYSPLGTLPAEQRMKLDEYVEAFFSAGKSSAL